MFKTLKYLFLARVYKRAKKSFILLSGSLISLLLVSLILNDAISVAGGISVYVLLVVKWAVILSLLVLAGYSALKIVNIAFSPFGEDKKTSVAALGMQTEKDGKKEYILNKEILLTKSDQILEKYMKDL